MIFVTLGTQDKQFIRLLKYIEDNIKNGVIKEKVIVQAGSTNFDSKLMEIKKFMDREEFKKYLLKAELIITHGGVGTILEAINHKKKVIGVARLKKYGEHVNDHQTQLLENFSKKEYIIYCKNLDDFSKYYNMSKNFIPKEFKSNQKIFNLELNKYISQNIENVEKKNRISKNYDIIKQAIKFFAISGTGWLMDMAIFTLLTNIASVSTIICNIISSFVAVTYVYFISTRKTFINNSTTKTLKRKYLYYIIYQVFIIILSSIIISCLSGIFSHFALISNWNKIIAKIVFTPVTMICNFIFMKWLIEKI